MKVGMLRSCVHAGGGAATMAPKKKDKEPEETLTRIAIVNEDRYFAWQLVQTAAR
jgi:hypothetical protein